MPPAQSGHHPPWPWTVAEEGSPTKRALVEKMFVAKSKTESTKKQSLSCLNSLGSAKNNNNKTKIQKQQNTKITTVDSSPTNNNNNYNNKLNMNKKSEAVSVKMQQGKITEYFKTQAKNGTRKELMKLKGIQMSQEGGKIAVINQLGSSNTKNGWRTNAAAKKLEFAKVRKLTSTVPRKILPAPSKMPEPIPASNPISSMHPLMTLTAISYPPNLTYLHTKTPKPPDNIFVPQFASIPNEKVSHTTIPIINRNQCLNVIQPVPKIATLNNFNCVKLNATVVPIVNLNALPSRLNGSNIANVTLSVDTAVPTVLPARPKVSENAPGNTSTGSAANSGCFPTPVSALGKQQYNKTNQENATSMLLDRLQCRTETSSPTEEPYRTEECQTHHKDQPQEPPDDHCWSTGNQKRISNQKSPSPTDSDSGISSRGSLEINVEERTVDEPKKSPILSQPKTIRFPPVQQHQKEKDEGRDLGKSPTQSNEGRCQWDDCTAQFDTNGALLEHLQVKHVISQSQANQEQYVCLWRGCKVHGRTSCSISWLERHVLAHAGTKPFRCIVDDCGQRFNSQLMLERHVNSHFNTDGTQTNNTKKSVENGPVKLFKRNGRIIRFRRQPWSARMFDFIDSGIMEGLQHKLLRMTQTRTLGHIGSGGEIVNFQSEILAKRTDSKGNKELLIRWHPSNITPDEWISEKEYKPTKALPIPSLSPEARESLSPILFPYSQRQAGQKHRRKPPKRT
ncbi:hypothetical protein ABEB36_004250 [Hypothenemus hampei]|uniref:C2H2-type domain-containing protein n=1 Tax=Hypothenemus hampei TaxID=57062 RepID=A0ABD1F2Q1_HYPHA